jgi:predicted transglutaminase-like cysteine proteinase
VEISVTAMVHDNIGSRSLAHRLGRVAASTLLAVGIVATTLGAAQATSANYPQIFGTAELHSDNLVRFNKWTTVIRRTEKEFKNCPAAGCDAGGWRQFISGVAGDDVVEQIRAVNSWFNRVTYISDDDNRGTPDYWSTPLEFLRDGGDCEDYAIAKYTALRQLGVPAENMRLVVLQHLQRNMPHAVLVVYANGKPYVLDNLLPSVRVADGSLPYRPVYSVNETGWWLHFSPKDKKPDWTQTASAEERTDAGASSQTNRVTLK